MDLQKSDNWADALAKVAKEWGDDYSGIHKELKINMITKTIKATDETVGKKISILEALSTKTVVMTPKIQKAIESLNGRIIGYYEVLRKYQKKLLSQLEDMMKKMEDSDQKKDFEEDIDFLDEELSVYTSDYYQIWRYQGDFFYDEKAADKAKAVVERFEGVGFVSGKLGNKIKYAEELLGIVSKRIRSYRGFPDVVLARPATSPIKIMGMKGDPLEKVYNSSLPGNSHGFRSVTTHIKHIIDINTALRKGGFDKADTFNQIPIKLMEGKDFADWEKYLKKAPRFIDLLTPYADPNSTINPKSFATQLEMLNEVESRVKRAKKILEKLRKDFSDLL